MQHWSIRAAKAITSYRWLVLVVALGVSALAIFSTQSLKVSTKLEALMPEGAQSVITLNDTMEKVGSFASIQVIIEGDDPQRVEAALFVLEAVTRRLLWAESVQYFEDISVLERHKLLHLSVPELEKVEATLEREMVRSAARSLEKNTGIPIKITLVGQGMEVSSNGDHASDPAAELGEPVETVRRFRSDDGRSQALVIWPRPGYEGLADAKAMIADVAAIIQALEIDAPDSGLKAGIAGRIRNKVAQFDAVMRDVTVGLGSSVSLILLILLLHYRRLMALPLIVMPLVIGILWTIGLTAWVIGGLNLITIFLALILFGLGIDFGIHNFSRYGEARGRGEDHVTALAAVLGHTGKASLVAGVTTAAGFLSLMLTEFRAFREFGFIAGSGILLIYLTMYSVFPAFLSVVQARMAWRAPSGRAPGVPRLAVFHHPRTVILGCLVLGSLAGVIVPDLAFEKNFKNIQAARSEDHLWATTRSKNIFKGGHDRAVLVVDTLEEVEAIEAYFEERAKTDTETPTVAKITSIRNFVPDRAAQAARLTVINRMWERLADSGPLPDDLSEKTRYLKIGMLEADDLPSGMRRVFLGNESKPGYLVYIYNSVTMDDADLARDFYDDAAAFTIGDKTYHPASEGFIFVEMLAMMKADAARAVAQVTLVTVLAVLIFCRSLGASLVILLPTLFGMMFTLAMMVLTDLKLSIINMVILPSLVGISVDNAIHIVERVRERGENIGSVMATTGRAAALTTLTTLVGFGGLVTASMGGLRSMGYLALIGFSLCLLVTWLLLPALVTFFNLRPKEEIYK